jgi:hypothetical protein
VFNLQPLIYVVFTLDLVVQSVEIAAGKVSLTFESLRLLAVVRIHIRLAFMGCGIATAQGAGIE